MAWVHRVLLEAKLGRRLRRREDVDHREHREADMVVDNRSANLRLATRSQNLAGRRDSLTRGRASRFLGVRQRASGRWEARLQTRSVGTFATEAEAARAYNRAARRRFGDYARLNEVPDG